MRTPSSQLTRAPDSKLLGPRFGYPAALSVITFVLGALELRVPPGLDQGILAYFGADILDGGVPFLTTWDHKPPGAHYLYALGFALFGRTILAIRLFDCLYVAAIALALYSLTAEWFDRLAGFVAGAVFVVGYYAGLGWWDMSQPDEYMLLPMLIGLRVVSGSRTGHKLAPAGWAGVCFGLAFIVKFVSAAVFVPVALLSVRDAIESRRFRDAVKAQLLLAGGFVAVNIALLLYLQSQHALGNFIESQTIFNRGYVLQGFRGSPGLIFSAFARFRLPAAYLSALLALAGFSSPRWAGLRHRAGFDSRGFAGTCALLASIALEIIAQAKFYTYHFIPLLAPIGMLAGCGASLLCARFSASRELRAALIALIALLLPVASIEFAKYRALQSYLTGRENHDAYYAQFGGYNDGGGFSFLACRQAADFIRSHSVATDRIYVFGFDPLLPFLAGRKLASRFTYNTPLIVSWGRPAWRRELMAELEQSKPRFIVVLLHDQHPWTTGRTLDSYDLMRQDFPELSHYAFSRYSACKTIEDYRFFCRRESASSP